MSSGERSISNCRGVKVRPCERFLPQLSCLEVESTLFMQYDTLPGHFVNLFIVLHCTFVALKGLQVWARVGRAMQAGFRDMLHICSPSQDTGGTRTNNAIS